MNWLQDAAEKVMIFNMCGGGIVLVVLALIAMKWLEFRDSEIARKRKQRIELQRQVEWLRRVNQNRRRLNLGPIKFILE